MHVDYICLKLEQTKTTHSATLSTLQITQDPSQDETCQLRLRKFPYALGEWVNEMLQPMVKAQHMWFRDSFALQRELNELKLPANASILLFDAVSTYTKIDINDCIARISAFLLNPQTQAQFPHYDAEALIEAIKLTCEIMACNLVI